MEIQELFALYKKNVDEMNKNLMTIAFDELENGQYEEAAAHFDQLYVQDPSDFTFYFLRTFFKSQTGRRGDVYPDSQKLTSALELSIKKTVENNKDIDTSMYIIIDLYLEGMENLADNAVEEVSIDANGKTRTSNPTKIKITQNMISTVIGIVKTYANYVKEDESLCELLLGFLHYYESYSLEIVGNAICILDPSYATTLASKIKKAKAKKIIGILIVVAILAAIAIAVIF